MQILKYFENKEKAAEILKEFVIQGKVVVVPTDTVYGLVCDATNAQAVKKLFEIKKREKEKPIGIFVRDLKMAKKFARIDKEKEKFLKKLGKDLSKVTLILRKREKIPVGTRTTIGIRIPDHPLIKNLFEKIDFPLAQTSANISGMPATTKIKALLRQFKAQRIKPDLVFDAGNLKNSKPSTVVDLTGKELKILREGKIKI